MQQPLHADGVTQQPSLPPAITEYTVTKPEDGIYTVSIKSTGEITFYISDRDGNITKQDFTQSGPTSYTIHFSKKALSTVIKME